MFSKVTSAIAGLTIGYAFCHVFIYQFLVRHLFSTLGIQLGNLFSSTLRGDFAISLFVMAYVICKIWGPNPKILRIGAYVGMATWLLISLFIA